MENISRDELEKMGVWVLRDLARKNGLNATGMRKAELVNLIYEKQNSANTSFSKSPDATVNVDAPESQSDDPIKKRSLRPYKPDLETIMPIITSNPNTTQPEFSNYQVNDPFLGQNLLKNESPQAPQFQKPVAHNPAPTHIPQSHYAPPSQLPRQEMQQSTFQQSPPRQFAPYSSPQNTRPHYSPNSSGYSPEHTQMPYNQNPQSTHERPHYQQTLSYGIPPQPNQYQREAPRSYQPMGNAPQQRPPYSAPPQRNPMQQARPQQRPPYNNDSQHQFSQNRAPGGSSQQRPQSRPPQRNPMSQSMSRAPRDMKSSSYEPRPRINNDTRNFIQSENHNEVKPTEQSTETLELRSGVLEICPDGFGFLRASNYQQGERDAYIAAVKIKKYGLRKGDYVVAQVRKITDNRPWNVVEVDSINGQTPEVAATRPNFDSLTPIFPDSRYTLELPTSKNDYAIRAIDLVAPIGKGQRGMIVSPPKAGKTTLLKKIAHSISANYPEAHLIVLLVDERPEEVTDMQRSISGEVVYSTFDEMPDHHTKAAEMVLERAKRLTELGKDVVIIMDSLTRLARAYNLVITPTGKTLSGGIDPGSLHNPKRFFGAARNIENGGSLTIIATALIDTGSRMDDVIYEEFKGTGNMEIHLDRKLSEKRIFPAIDLNRSGTRREELLLDQKELDGIWAIRKMLSSGETQESTESLLNYLVKSTNNREFIDQLTVRVNQLAKEGFVMR
ncbi:MAG: transcription termination factor Rho [Christensenellaceae bacterium]|jgi:transcription termination factor Rho|nr:transcription termination factor Rho [Christensenellaceae bacterium]